MKTTSTIINLADALEENFAAFPAGPRAALSRVVRVTRSLAARGRVSEARNGLALLERLHRSFAGAGAISDTARVADLLTP